MTKGDLILHNDPVSAINDDTIDDRLIKLLDRLAKQIMPSSRKTYAKDVRVFIEWLTARGTDLFAATRDDMIDYYHFLDIKPVLRHNQTTHESLPTGKVIERATAARMFSVARSLLDEATRSRLIPFNPAADIDNFKTNNDETPHTALSLTQAREMLVAIDRTTGVGKRDYALIQLLMRTGLRRNEVAALTLSDFKMEQGHHILTVRHGKGDKRRTVKLPVDVMRAITDYLEYFNRKSLEPNAPLFVAIRRGDHVDKRSDGGDKELSAKRMEEIVIARGRAIGVEHLTPHGLRATFVTLTLEGGAALHKVQRAAGHKDPRTTERYQRRKDNLDDNAVDYLRLST